MTAIAQPPKPGQKLKIVAAYSAFIATLFIDPKNLDGKQWLLIAIAAAGFFCAGVCEWKQHKARKEWEKTQPADTSFVGAPDLPHVKQLISFLIGMGSFMVLGYLWMPHKESGLVGNEWWMLVLIPVSVAGFWYSRRIQKQHDKQFEEWLQARARNSQ